MSKEQVCTTCKKANDAAPLSLIGECQGCYENATDQAWWDKVRKIEPTKPDAQEYADDYTFRGDADYIPNAQEQTLIQDALLGFECEMDDYVKALQAEIDALKAAQTWISVKDQMPPNDEPVLVNCSNSPYKPPYQTTVASYINAGSMHIHSDEASADWCDYDDESGEYTAQEGWYEQVGLSNPECGCMQMSFNVTHWMPLPPAPETTK